MKNSGEASLGRGDGRSVDHSLSAQGWAEPSGGGSELRITATGGIGRGGLLEEPRHRCHHRTAKRASACSEATPGYRSAIYACSKNDDIEGVARESLALNAPRVSQILLLMPTSPGNILITTPTQRPPGRWIHLRGRWWWRATLTRLP